MALLYSRVWSVLSTILKSDLLQKLILLSKKIWVILRIFLDYLASLKLELTINSALEGDSVFANEPSFSNRSP